MQRHLQRIGWMGLLLGGFTLGCTKSAVQQKPVADPLLLTKPAVEGRNTAAQASPIHRMEATPPPPAPAGIDAPTSN